MELVKISTLEVTDRQRVVANYPNTSFPATLTNEILRPLGYLVLEEDESPELEDNQYFVPGEVRIEEGEDGDRAVRGWEVKASPTYTDEVVIPESVSRAQGKAALLGAGLLGAVEDFIGTLEGDEKALALLAFNETNEWRRDSPFLNQAATALGVTQEQMDELFLEASKIAL